VLKVLGLGQLHLTDESPDFYGKIHLRGAQLTLRDNARLHKVTHFTLENGGWLALNNLFSGHADRISDTATITLNAGILSFNPGNHGIHTEFTEKFGTLDLAGGANRIDLFGPSGRLLAAELTRFGEFGGDSRATLNLEYVLGIGPDFSLIPVDPTQVYFAIEKGPVAQGGIFAWATVTQNFGQQVDWVEPWDDGAQTIFNLLQNYQTGGVADWLASDNVLIDGNTATLPGQFDFLEINSLKLANGSVLDLGDNNALQLLSGGLLSTAGFFDPANRITGNGTLINGSAGPLYAHIYGGGLSVEGGASISASFAGFVKAGEGTLRFASQDTDHSVPNLYIHEGTISLNAGTIVTGNIVIGDGYGTDVLELPANRNNPISGSNAMPTITLHGQPYGNPNSGEYDAAILRFGGSTHQNAYSLHVEGRGTLDFVGGTPAEDFSGVGPNYLFLEEFTLADFETTMLFIRHWEDKRDFLLVRHDAVNIARIDAAFLARINFEGYGEAQWIYWSDEYWEITPFPEPTTYGALLAAVGLGLWAWQKRRQKQSLTPTR